MSRIGLVTEQLQVYGQAALIQSRLRWRCRLPLVALHGERSLRRRGGLNVLAVVEHVLGVAFGFHLDEPPVAVVAVGLPDAGRVVVGVQEVHIDVGAVGLQGVEEYSGPRGLRRLTVSSRSGSQAASMMMLWSTSHPG
jgi:hypothetical protein